jgi:uncharacterized protein YcnI
VAGSSTKVSLRVGHGCAGLPTTALRVQIPAGFLGSKPMPKAGWTVTVQRSKLAQTYDSHGKTITEDVSDITWTASQSSAALLDEQFDEFVLRGTAPETAGPIWFKVFQLCQDGGKTGSNPWTEVPDSGISTKGLKFPAALLNVTAPAASASPVAPLAPAVGAAGQTEHKH